MGSDHPAQVIVFYQPRSACRVLCRMLFEKQSNVVSLEHIFGNCRGCQVQWLRSDDYENGMKDSLHAEFDHESDAAIAKWQKTLAETRHKDQTLVVQTYPFSPVNADTVLKVIQMTSKNKQYVPIGNFTTIPESLLLTEGTVPVLVIRDPRLIVTSAYRVLHNMGISEGGGRPMYLATTCTIWSRLMYDYYVEKGMKPIVLDSDDFMTGQDFVQRLCRAIGVNPEQAIFSWPSISSEEKQAMDPMDYASGKIFLDSTGVDSGRAARNIDFAKEEDSWAADFGIDIGLVREMIELALPHYQYMVDNKWYPGK